MRNAGLIGAIKSSFGPNAAARERWDLFGKSFWEAERVEERGIVKFDYAGDPGGGWG